MDKHLFCIMGFSTETQKLPPGKGIKGGGERGVGGLNSSYWQGNGRCDIESIVGEWL